MGTQTRRRYYLLCATNLGTPKFPFSYPEHVTLPTPAQARLSPCSGFAQAGSPLLTLITIFGKLRRSLNHFNSSRRGPELVPYIKMAKMCPLEISVLQVSRLHLLQTLLLLFNPEFINISRQNITIQHGTGTKDVRFSKDRY